MRLWQSWQHYSVGALECSARKVKRCPEGSFAQFSKERLSNACKSYDHTLIKILSHRVPNTTKLTLEKLFQEQNQYDAKLAHLVRDPRGVVYSRVKLRWMKKNFNRPKFRKSVQNVFDPILQNIRLGLLSCPSWLRDSFKVVRNEDLVANMVNVTRDLYKFAGLGWSSNVVKWISTLDNNSKYGRAYSVLRNAAVHKIMTCEISERFRQFYFFTKRSTLLVKNTRKTKFLHSLSIEQNAKLLPFLSMLVV